MNNIEIQELTGDNWIAKSTLDFGYVPVGKNFVSKTIRFSPINCNVADFKAKIEKSGDDWVFVDTKDHLTDQLKSIGPFKIMKGEVSEPIKIEFLVKSGPVRLDSFRLLFSFLEIPCDE